MCQGIFASYSWKKKYLSCHWDDGQRYDLWFGPRPRSHFMILFPPFYHIERQLCGIDQNKSTTGANKRNEARKHCQTDGCTAEIPATCEAKILIEGTKNVNHLEYGFRN